MTDAVDFKGLFETLPDAIAVCDDDGNVVAINRQARAYLAVDGTEALRIELHSRETVRQIRLTNVSAAEFFLADVGVHGAPRSRVSASFHPLGPGAGYRVVFAAGPDGRPVSVNIRMLEALVNVGRHLDLFKTADKTLALFAASFVEVFPTYSFRVEVAHGFVHEHPGWADAQCKPNGAVDWGHVRTDALSFRGAVRGWRVAIADIGSLLVERADDTKFGVSERQAFETFTQQLGLALSRIVGDTSSDAMLVGPIIDQLDAIVIVCDARRRVLVSNRTFESIVGSTTVVGHDLLEYFDEREQPRLRMAAASVMASGEPELFEAHLRTTNGRVALRMQLAPARGRDGAEGTTGFVVTGQQGELSLVELEERMTRAEQLMNLGELATGVAHELKNPLTSILNYAEYLLAKYQPGTEVVANARAGFDERDAQRLERIIAGVAQIDDFVKDLVTLARPNEGQVAPVNVHSVIHESVMMCEVALAQARTTVKLELADTPPIVPGFRNQLKQVFVNLVANAGKSMPAAGGTIVLRTELVRGRVLTHIVDDGAGMSPETLARIFEPFFTTRQTRGGSGLGLALVRTIVERHGGEVTVESVLGAGTTFTVALPTVDE